MMCARITIVSLAIFCFLTGAAIGSDLTLAPERVLSDQDFDEFLPQVAYNSVRDEYLVVWHDVSLVQARSIMGQRLGRQGNLIDEFVIAFEDSPPRDNAQPTVAHDPFHDLYLVAWSRDYFGNGSDWDIYGRIIPGDGPSPSHLQFSINGNTSNQWNPRVDFATLQSEFLVTWTNEVNGGVAGHISAERVDPAGTISGSPITVASGTGERANPDVAYNAANNEYLVVYQRMDTGAGDVYGVRIGSGGAILGGGEFAIAGWPDPELYPRVASSRVIDEWAVTWESTRSASATDIFARRVWVDGGGAVQHGTPKAVAEISINESHSDIAAHPSNTEYLIAWENQYSNLAGPFGILARTFSFTDVLGPISVIRPVYAGFEVDSATPEIAASRTDYFVTWRQERFDGTHQDIWGRTVMGPLFADGFETGSVVGWSSWQP